MAPSNLHKQDPQNRTYFFYLSVTYEVIYLYNWQKFDKTSYDIIKKIHKDNIIELIK